MYELDGEFCELRGRGFWTKTIGAFKLLIQKNYSKPNDVELRRLLSNLQATAYVDSWTSSPYKKKTAWNLSRKFVISDQLREWKQQNSSLR